MKLDRHINPDGRGKYALINYRTLRVELGDTPETEFFVIKLKDKYAMAALYAYAHAAELDGEHEWADEVRALAARSGPAHPLCHTPD
jgi:hypothetical protein